MTRRSTVRAPELPEWPRCGAKARSTGLPCRREGSALGGRCTLHGGLTLVNAGWREPRPEFELRVTPSGIFVAPDRAARNSKPCWPQRISAWVALRLAADGRVNRALVYRGLGKEFLAELELRGVVVTPDGTWSRLVRRFRFQTTQCERLPGERRWQTEARLGKLRAAARERPPSAARHGGSAERAEAGTGLGTSEPGARSQVPPRPGKRHSTDGTHEPEATNG
jgi:hypothetical protein